MITTTAARPVECRTVKPRDRRAGFSLIELMVAATLSGIIMAGVLTTFLFFSKSGVRMIRYTDMESNARDALGRFAQDVRQAEDATWVSAHSLRLTVAAAQVTYTYNSSAKTVSRTVAGSTEVLVTRIIGFKFTAYNIDMTALDLQGNLTTAGKATKMIQMDIDLSDSTASAGVVTSQILSARYVLRNKKVS